MTESLLTFFANTRQLFTKRRERNSQRPLVLGEPLRRKLDILVEEQKFRGRSMELYLNSMLYEKKNAKTSFDLSTKELVFYPQLYDLYPPSCQWYDVRVTSHNHLLKDITKYIEKYAYPDKCYPILKYLSCYNFVEMYLENFAFTTSNLPKEIFECENLQLLSLKGNKLTTLPPEIGKLWKLYTLVLSENQLTMEGLPYTLLFCQNLIDLYLDGNPLMAVPAFIVKMKTLRNLVCHQSVRFEMTYKRCHLNNRLEKLSTHNEEAEPPSFNPKSLVQVASSGIAAAGIDIYWIENFESDYMLLAEECLSRPVCDKCCIPRDEKEGYAVYGLHFSKVGKRWFPVVYFACTLRCAQVLLDKIPEREKQCVLQFLGRQYGPCVIRARSRIHKNSRWMNFEIKDGRA